MSTRLHAWTRFFTMSLSSSSSPASGVPGAFRGEQGLSRAVSCEHSPAAVRGELEEARLEG